MKKVDMHKFLEEMRKLENVRLEEFLQGLDPKTEAKMMKLLYYYNIGQRQLTQQMKTEALEFFQEDWVMSKLEKNERRLCYNKAFVDIR